MCCLTTTVKAQVTFSDSLQISLLTCSEGPDAYERFGHSGVRILDLNSGQDIVFHWGVFMFNAPLFVYRFTKGETDYQLGAEYMDDFVRQYARRGLAMKEQVLNLNKDELNDALAAILTNYRPENRTYRYSFFFDNCATRPFNIINKSTDNKITYDTSWVRDITMRDMIQEKTFLNNWLDLGISLAVAGRADKQTTFKEQMFLPEYLSNAFNHASLGDKPLVKEEHILLEMRPEIKEKIIKSNFFLSPNFIFFLLMALFIALFCLAKNNQSWANTLKVFESVFLLATGLTGVILYFLNFISLHPAVDHNVNCLWLLPTNIIFAALIWVKSAEKVNRIYFFIIFALIIAYAIINFIFVHQYVNPAFAPLLVTMINICAHQNKRLLYWRNRK